MYDHVKVTFKNGSVVGLYVPEDENIHDEIVLLCDSIGWNLDDILSWTIVGRVRIIGGKEEIEHA